MKSYVHSKNPLEKSINDLRVDKSKTIVEMGNLGCFCTGCGTCAGTCPSDAISLFVDRDMHIYLPNVDKSKCIHCGMCVRVCPGISTDYEEIGLQIFGKQPNDNYLGNYMKCYVGHSTDDEIRYNSSSGGLVTSLLRLALEDGTIEGAAVIKMDRGDALRAKAFVAQTPSAITSAAKSKYCPVPMNVLLKEIMSREGRYAVVGLPCHIHGIRKAEQLFPILRKRIVLHLGLFCSHNVNFAGTEYFIRRLGVSGKDVSTICYRGGGWPGAPYIKLKDGTTRTDAKGEWNKMFASRFFTPARCMFCQDSTNELADLSFGDPWLPRFKNERIGKSILICRTPVGDTLLKHAISMGRVELFEISADETKKSQESLSYKKKAIFAYCRLIGLPAGVKISSHGSVSPSLIDYLISTLLLFNTRISAKKYLWPVLFQWSKLMKLVRGFQTRRHLRARSVARA